MGLYHSLDVIRSWQGPYQAKVLVNERIRMYDVVMEGNNSLTWTICPNQSEEQCQLPPFMIGNWSVVRNHICFVMHGIQPELRPSETLVHPSKVTTKVHGTCSLQCRLPTAITQAFLGELVVEREGCTFYLPLVLNGPG